MNQVLAPAGPQAAHIADLWWLTLGVCAFVFVVLLAALAWALWRAPRAQSTTPPELERAPEGERKAGRSIAAALAVSAILLVGLLVASIATDRALAQLALGDALNVRVTAHQWWWEIVYPDEEPQRIFATANELHIPVGRPVQVTLNAGDVIHSFWVPKLHGKKDLIPGRTTTIRFRADAAGTYRGVCAEFCGLEHAFMAFDVVAMPPGEFEAWSEAQRQPAPEPRDALTQRGRELFLTGSCMMCHAIQGTPSNAHQAPDLTHVASRAHLAAGRLENTPQDLAAWILDPQKLKPGANMPAHTLPGEDLQALVAYLETLK